MGADQLHAERELWICELGVVPYREASALQEQVRERRQDGRLPDSLLLLEHPPVYTHGRRAQTSELPRGEDFYRARGVEVLASDRGGRVTYHGPGQLVGYPIMRIRDLGTYLRAMEAAIVAALADHGVRARSRWTEGADYTGVWVQERKIASIGVHVRAGVTTHGFAINVDNDLEPFSWVIACGLPEVAMTSVAQEQPAGRRVDAAAMRASVAGHFCRLHERVARVVSREQLVPERVAA